MSPTGSNDYRLASRTVVAWVNTEAEIWGKRMKFSRLVILTASLAALSACDAVVLSPSGDIAAQQRDVLVISTLLMLLIIIPVMALTIFFAWKYRESNREAKYEPDWHHSTQLELIIWAAPLIIIICLGALTWVGTHLLDPYRSLDRVAAGRDIEDAPPVLEVEVVALDWKWLFIYPEYGIATVNELAAPVDRPVHFRITSLSVMNSFYVPALAGMIYAMPGMQTRLNAVINNPGVYDGFSSNYSGAGFSGMRFKFHGLADEEFDAWIETVQASEGVLDRAEYLELAQPSENVPAIYFSEVDPLLFHLILNMCVEEGRMCMNEMMAIDSQGGMGLAGLTNVVAQSDAAPLRSATRPVFGRERFFVASICTIEDSIELYGSSIAQLDVERRDPSPMRGRALPRPGMVPAFLNPPPTGFARVPEPQDAG